VGVRGVGVVAVIGLVASALAAAPASAATYSNPTPVLDPQNNVVGAHPLDPYPSTIPVSGEQGTVTKATVTLLNASGGPERDLDVLLVAPGGSTLLLSDICSAGGVIPDFPVGGGSTFTFDDDAAGPIPDTCTTQPPSGTYKPSNYDTSDSFPGIAAPYPVGLANVRGTSPNGDWSLYAVDDSYPDPVTINGGWTLTLTTTGPAPATAVVPTATRKKCKHRKHRSASAAKKKRCKKKKRR
jgi:hypothetical protein